MNLDKAKIMKIISVLIRIIPLLFLLLCAYQCEPIDGDGDAEFYFYLGNQTADELIMIKYGSNNINIDTLIANDTIYLFPIGLSDTLDLANDKKELLNDAFDSVLIYKNDTLLKTYLPGSAFFEYDNWNEELTYKGEVVQEYFCYYTITEDSLKNWE